MGEMKTGTGETFAEPTGEDPEMTTGDGTVLSGPNAGSQSSGDDEPTKAELMEEAREKDIPGRSSMTKEELAKAVEEA